MEAKNTSMRSVEKYYISALYRAILKREPDEKGLADHIARAEKIGFPIYYEIMLNDFLSCKEASGQLYARLVPKLIAPLMEIAKGIPIISLGSHCANSYIWKIIGLKHESGPFDWIFSNPAMVADCLQDNFSLFLDRSQFMTVPVAERISPTTNLCDHLYFKSKYGIKCIFNHRDPCASDEDYRYVIRCVERFRNQLTNNSLKLFVLLTEETARSLDDFKLVANRLSALARKYKFIFVTTNINPSVGEPTGQLLYESPVACFAKMTSLGPLGPVNFDEVIDMSFFINTVLKYAVSDL